MPADSGGNSGNPTHNINVLERNLEALDVDVGVMSPLGTGIGI